jgi:hypothetical protein
VVVTKISETKRIQAWTVEISGTSKTTVLVKDGVPVARFYANCCSNELLNELLEKLNK